MKDNQGNNKDHFTVEDWIYTLQMLPNEKWTENEAEQTLQQLLQEGKIREMEPGKFKPNVEGGDSS